MIKWLMNLFKRKKKPKSKGIPVVIIGHEEHRQGAKAVYPFEFTEYEYNTELAEMIQTYCSVSGLKIKVIDRTNLGIKGAYRLAKFVNASVIVELHFNSFDGRASGCETLVVGESIRELEFATYIQAAMVDALGNKDRGIKQLDYGNRGYYNISQINNVPSVIVEPFFGSSKTDATRGSEERVQLAKAIGNALLEF